MFQLQLTNTENPLSFLKSIFDLGKSPPLNKENPLSAITQNPSIPIPSPQAVDSNNTDMNANSLSVELTVHVDGKIDGMTENNQGAIVTALVSRFKQPDWLNIVSNGYTRRANR